MNGTNGGTVPRLTIGMPVWNSAATIGESIESLLVQDFTDFELVVSDNASDDGTAEIADKYAEKDPRVRVVRHAVNRGGTANFNDLVPMARGELFKWASGDDLVGQGYLSKAVAALDADAGVVMAYCGSRLIDEAGRTVREHRDGLDLRQDEAWRRMRGFAADRWLCNPMFGVFRTAVLRDVTLLTTKVNSDVTVLAQVALRGKVAEVPERLFLRRVQESSVGLGSLDRTTLAKWFDPSGRPPLVPPKLRVLWDVNVAVVRAPLPAGERVKALLAHDGATVARAAGLAREVIMLRRKGIRPGSWIEMRERLLTEKYPAGSAPVEL